MELHLSDALNRKCQLRVRNQVYIQMDLILTRFFGSALDLLSAYHKDVRSDALFISAEL